MGTASKKIADTDAMTERLKIASTIAAHAITGKIEFAERIPEIVQNSFALADAMIAGENADARKCLETNAAVLALKQRVRDNHPS